MIEISGGLSSRVQIDDDCDGTVEHEIHFFETGLLADDFIL